MDVRALCVVFMRRCNAHPIWAGVFEEAPTWLTNGLEVQKRDIPGTVHGGVIQLTAKATSRVVGAQS